MADNNKYWSDIEHYIELNAERSAELAPLAGPGPAAAAEAPGVGRRDFLKLGGVAAVFSMLGCMQRPAEKIIPYLNRPEEITPGVADYYATVCNGCSMTCGMVVKTREGRPIKVEGNPDNPLNRGRLCARGQASVFDLYDPDRSRKPMFLQKNGAWGETTFEEADAAILKELKGLQGEVVFFSGPWHGPARTDLIEKFVAGLGSASHIKYNPLRDESYLESRRLVFGRTAPVRYRMDLSRVSLLLGADPFASGRFYIENLRQFAEVRKPEDGKMARLVAFEPGMSETGVMADERYPVKPFDLVKVAGALVNQLLIIEKKSTWAADSALCSVFAPYDPSAVEKELGLKSGLIARLAAEMWEARGASLVLTENFSNQFPGSLALHAAGHVLNVILGNEGVTVETRTIGDQQAVSSYAEIDVLVKKMYDGRVSAIIIDNVNPAYSLPVASEFTRALPNVPLRISLSSYLDETARLCRFLLPGLHAQESWGDAEPLNGLYMLQQPTITPIWENRQAEDTLLSLGAGLGIKEFQAKDKPLAWSDYLKYYWRESLYPKLDLVSEFEPFWIGALERGHVQVSAAGSDSQSQDEANVVAVTQAMQGLPESREAGFQLTLTACSLHLDGRSMNNPWLLELPHPVTRITWDNYINVSTADALALKVKEGDTVRVSAGNEEIIAPVHIKPGQASGALSIDVGWGRAFTGATGDDRGVNAFAMTAVANGHLGFTRGGVQVVKAGGQVPLASVQGWPTTLGRPIVFETTLEEFRADPKAGQFEHAAGGEKAPNLPENKPSSLWFLKGHKYPGHRWAMAIDLNKCNGCGACTVACQVENNIPYVGKASVLNGREMHWIRIDRYFSGDPDNPDPTYQPMLCHQCGNAPCETVCPVLATVHNDEGLNLQVYNRCVGTRYCSNNCPYKVRRFNFYEFSKEAYGDEPLNFTLNPEVMVREKGVMEKCSFCIQRIRAARYRAKERGIPVRDGEVIPACAQTCPTGAIVFGDRNDPESRVSKLLEEPRAFHALEELNIDPQLAYLTLVRNRSRDYAPKNLNPIL